MPTIINGDGVVTAGGTASTQGKVVLAEQTGSGTNTVTIQAPATLASDLTFTMPTADGTNGQFLQTNGSGALAFATVPTTSPAGSTGQLQINNAGAFGAVSSGTNGQYLTSGGAGNPPTWTTPAAGALTLLATATASSSATVLLNVTAGYDNYLVLLTGIRPDTADAVLFLRVTTSSTVRTGNYSWNGQAFQSGQATGFGTNSTGISYIPVSSTTTGFSAGMSTNSDSSLDAQINLANLASTTQYKKIFSEASYNRGSTMISCSTVAGYYGDTAAVTALTFLMNSGNIASGTFRLYGYSNS